MTDLIAGLHTLGPLHWAALGLVLIGIEMMLGTFDLLWIGVAALIAAAITVAAPDVASSWQWQAACFAATATVLLVASRTVFSGMRNSPSSHPDLNSRTAKMVGERAIVSRDFVGGHGRVRYGDTEWLASCDGQEALLKGREVLITGAHGVELRISPV